jgi:uncharacterized protein with HEPN domain
MQRDLATLLWDVDQAASRICNYTHGHTLQEYEENPMMREAVERAFILIGEALVRASRIAPAEVSQIANCGQIIGFRHVLTHGYDSVDNRRVWSTIQEDLPPLQADVRQLLKNLSETEI